MQSAIIRSQALAAVAGDDNLTSAMAHTPTASWLGHLRDCETTRLVGPRFGDLPFSFRACGGSCTVALVNTRLRPADWFAIPIMITPPPPIRAVVVGVALLVARNSVLPSLPSTLRVLGFDTEASGVLLDCSPAVYPLCLVGGERGSSGLTSSQHSTLTAGLNPWALPTRGGCTSDPSCSGFTKRFLLAPRAWTTYAPAMCFVEIRHAEGTGPSIFHEHAYPLPLPVPCISEDLEGSALPLYSLSSLLRRSVGMAM